MTGFFAGVSRGFLPICKDIPFLPPNFLPVFFWRVSPTDVLVSFLFCVLMTLLLQSAHVLTHKSVYVICCCFFVPCICRCDLKMDSACSCDPKLKLFPFLFVGLLLLLSGWRRSQRITQLLSHFCSGPFLFIIVDSSFSVALFDSQDFFRIQRVSSFFQVEMISCLILIWWIK